MPDKPNIIFYVSDSLRADHVSCYGYDRETSPNVDRLANDGIRFEQCFAQAVKTVEASVSVLTGLYPPAHRAHTTYHGVPPDAPRITHKLRKQGYTTAGFSSVVQLPTRRGFGAGFDTFEELFRTHRATDGFTDWAKICTDQTIEWLDKQDESPFFLFVWTDGIHDPYAPRANVFSDENPESPIDGSLGSLQSAEKEQADVVCDLYDDAIRHSDEHFGRLLDYLERTGLYDETLIVFLGDHGEILSEHARLEHAYAPARYAFQKAVPNFCRSYTLFEPGAHVGHLGALPYDELLHVPAIVKPPGGTCRGVTRNGLVETVDLMPTVADLAGVGFETQGVSLVPLFDDDKPFKQYVYSDTAISRGVTNLRSVRTPEYKLIRTDWELSRLRHVQSLDIENTLLSKFQKLLTRSELFFDLPDEKTNIASKNPELRDVLAERLDTWIQRGHDSFSGAEISDIDEESRNQMQKTKEQLVKAYKSKQKNTD